MENGSKETGKLELFIKTVFILTFTALSFIILFYLEKIRSVASDDLLNKETIYFINSLYIVLIFLYSFFIIKKLNFIGVNKIKSFFEKEDGVVKFNETKAIKKWVSIGLFLVFIGFIVQIYSDISLLASITSKTMYFFGGVCLGSGVLGSIINSEDFSRIFQKKIFDVFNDPEGLKNIISISERWKALTSSRLKASVPGIYKKATEQIERQYFDDELNYYFDSLSLNYDIEIDEQEKKLKISNTFEAGIVRNPTKERVFFEQGITPDTDEDGECKLTELELMKEPVHERDQYLEKNKEDPQKYDLKIELPVLASPSVHIRRRYKHSEGLNQHPYVAFTSSKYITGGATVSIRVTEGYKVKLIQTGASGVTKPDPIDRDDRWTTWHLSNQQELILPGNAYIFLIERSCK